MKILIFGDSITQGFHDSEAGGWSNRLHTYFIKVTVASDWVKYYPVFSLGISGDCTERLLARFDDEAKVRRNDSDDSDLIMFAIGINDTQRYVFDNHIKTPIEQFNKNLEGLYNKANKFANQIVFLGLLPIREEALQPMPWAPDRSHFAQDVTEYDAAIKKFCKNNNCLFIPMLDMFSGELEQYLPDGIHPNSEGHALIFERVKNFLENNNIL